MERKEQPFCNTAEVMKKVNELYEFQKQSWQGFKGDIQTFIDLQEQVKPEYNYLKSFWNKNEQGEETDVKDNMFIPWNCLRAFDDLPQDLQDYVLNRGIYKGYFAGYCKYDVFHRREEHLDFVLGCIFKLFHDWQFVTQGWTAY